MHHSRPRGGMSSGGMSSGASDDPLAGLDGI